MGRATGHAASRGCCRKPIWGYENLRGAQKRSTGALYSNALRAGRGAADHARSGIAGSDNHLHDRFGMFRRARYQEPAGRLRIGEEMALPVWQARWELHVLAVAPPIS